LIGKTVRHYLSVRLGLDIPQTQTTEAERVTLKEYLPGKKRIVEIGVFEGFTTRLLAEASDTDATVYGVDPFFSGRVGISWGRKITETYNHTHIKNGKLKLIPTLSTEVGEQVPDKIDYVFIDGDHSLRVFTEDWTYWSVRVRTGGIIALHDTLHGPGQSSEREFGSHKYFRSHIQHDERFDIVDRQDSLSVLKKK